jgi:hypothetical protein
MPHDDGTFWLRRREESAIITEALNGLNLVKDLAPNSKAKVTCKVYGRFRCPDDACRNIWTSYYAWITLDCRRFVVVRHFKQRCTAAKCSKGKWTECQVSADSLKEAARRAGRVCLERWMGVPVVLELSSDRAADEQQAQHCVADCERCAELKLLNRMCSGSLAASQSELRDEVEDLHHQQQQQPETASSQLPGAQNTGWGLDDPIPQEFARALRLENQTFFGVYQKCKPSVSDRDARCKAFALLCRTIKAAYPHSILHGTGSHFRETDVPGSDVDVHVRMPQQPNVRRKQQFRQFLNTHGSQMEHLRRLLEEYQVGADQSGVVGSVRACIRATVSDVRVDFLLKAPHMQPKDFLRYPKMQDRLKLQTAASEVQLEYRHGFGDTTQQRGDHPRPWAPFGMVVRVLKNYLGTVSGWQCKQAPKSYLVELLTASAFGPRGNLGVCTPRRVGLIIADVLRMLAECDFKVERLREKDCTPEEAEKGRCIGGVKGHAYCMAVGNPTQDVARHFRAPDEDLKRQLLEVAVALEAAAAAAAAPTAAAAVAPPAAAAAPLAAAPACASAAPAPAAGPTRPAGLPTGPRQQRIVHASNC